MNTAGLADLLRPLPRRERIRVDSQVERLKRICETDQPLEEYLREVLVTIGRLLGATATAFWFRPFGAASLCAAVRHGFDTPELEPATLKAADAAVLNDWRQPHPIAQRLEDAAAGVIVAPVRGGQEAIGAIQIVFDCPPQNWDAVSRDYLACVGKIMIAIQPSLHRRINVPTASLEAANEAMEQLTKQLNHIQRSIRQAIEAYLHSIAGQSFGSLSENQRFVRSVQTLLESHGLRVRCPECGHPAILRCSRSGSSGSGAFVFDHYIQGRRTFHGGGSIVPKVRVIAKPARRGAVAAAT